MNSPHLIHRLLLISLLGLSACSGNGSLEGLFAPNPELPGGNFPTPIPSPTISPTPSPNNSPIPTPSPTSSLPLSPGQFSDIEEVPEPFRDYIQDLAELEVLSAVEGGDRFDPNKPITRREYARWLITANNTINASVSSKQIRPGSKTDQPAFQDVAVSDPDFGSIQGLAEAGLIPSKLSGDDTAIKFRPDAPLTREDLVHWKVPLDNRKALPTATIDQVKETWGFQDATKISPEALKAVYSDFQNGEKANIRRVFGFTTLFQPKKAITRAQAAASLWYFGFQGEGISATEALEIQSSESLPTDQPSPSPNQTLSNPRT